MRRCRLERRHLLDGCRERQPGRFGDDERLVTVGDDQRRGHVTVANGLPRCGGVGEALIGDAGAKRYQRRTDEPDRDVVE